MEIEGEQIIKKGKRMPKWIFVGYVICIAVIIFASVSMEKRQRVELPEAIDFTTDGALGMEEGKYAYLEVQGLTDEIATYGSTDDTSDSAIDRYCVAYNNGYWYVVDLNLETIDELKDIRKLNPESFTKEMKKELQECENRLHNYQRSQEMNNTLNEAGIEDSIENNQMIVENLLDAAKEVTDGNTEIISYIEGVNGKVQVVSRWKILPDGTPYLATVILKPMK